MPAFDRVSEVYDATRSLRPDVMEVVLDGLEQALGGTNILLDVGVGTGRFADSLRRLGFEVVGGKRIRRKHEFSLVMWTPRELQNLHPST